MGNSGLLCRAAWTHEYLIQRMEAMRKAKILTTGMYVPDYVVTNDLLAQARDTSDEWITQRTGIKERRMVPDTYKMLQQLARAPDKEAYLRTLYESGLDGNINAEMTTADLALAATPTFSLNQCCAGFIYALSLADQYIKTGTYHTILVLGAEILSSIFQYSNRGRDMSVLFADGAGAAILVPAADDEPSGFLSHHLHTDGTLLSKLYGELFGTTTFPPFVKQKIDG